MALECCQAKEGPAKDSGSPAIKIYCWPLFFLQHPQPHSEHALQKHVIAYRPAKPTREKMIRATAEASPPNRLAIRLYLKNPMSPQLRAPITNNNLTIIRKKFINHSLTCKHLNPTIIKFLIFVQPIQRYLVFLLYYSPLRLIVTHKFCFQREARQSQMEA